MCNLSFIHPFLPHLVALFTAPYHDQAEADNSEPRLPSPTQRSGTQARFALGGGAVPRDPHGCSPELGAAYEAGFEDALRAVRDGVIVMGNQHCES